MVDVLVNEIHHRNVKFMCKVGSITTSQADVVVLSSDPQYSMSVGAAKAVATIGGAEFDQRRVEAIQDCRENNESYLTIDTEDMDQIPYKCVIVLPVRNRNRSSMRVIYRQALKAAIDSQMQTVNMPLIGCGGLNINIDRASQELLEAILTFSSFANLSTINFLDINLQNLQSLGQLLDTIPLMYIAPGSSNTVANGPAPASLPSSSHNVSSDLSDVTVVMENIRAGPSVLPRNEVQFVQFNQPEKSEESTKEKDAGPFHEIARDEVGNNDTDPNATQSFPCSICLNDLVTSAGDGEEDAASLASDPVIRMRLCPHEYHRSCIQTCFDTKKRCPLCMRWYAPSFGLQPKNAVMRVKRIAGSPLGHESADGWFSIKYVIPSGIQGESHPRPNVPFSGTTRVAYLPNDEEGRLILSLLRKAFEHRHIFGIGDSLTTGAQNVPVWVIHHKTSMTGGPPNYGYPDPTFYARIRQELEEVGITAQMLN